MISSTFTDLETLRKHAEAALNNHDLHPVMMEYQRGRSDDGVVSSSLAMVAKSAAYICILARKYGQTPACPIRNPDGRSVTELEFDAAMNRPGLPVHVFIMGPDYLTAEADYEPSETKRQKLAAFKERAKVAIPGGTVHRIYKTFNSEADFIAEIRTTAATLQAEMATLPEAADPPTPTPTPTPSIDNITIPIPRHFLGRDTALAAIQTALQSPQARAAITALHGMRGVGKTVLAAAYADRHRAEYRATWWLRAATPETLRADLVALAIRLAWLPPDAKEEESLPRILARLRNDGAGLLLIYDNAIDAKSLAPYLPPGGAARIIITSNSPARGDLAEPVEIDIWPAVIGADFLLARTGRPTAAPPADRAAAVTLSETLGGLPLAHEMAAAFCEQTRLPFAAYAARFAATPLPLLDDATRAPGAYHHGTTVARAFTLAIEQATARHPAAAPLLAHAALLAPEPIPVFLFAEARDHLGEPLATLLDGLGLENAIAALRDFALIAREPIPDERDPTLSTDSLRLHRLVRTVAAARLPAGAADHAHRALLSALTATYPGDVFKNPAAWPRARRLDPLALALVDPDAPPSPGTESHAASLLNLLGEFRCGALGAYAYAQLVLERALAVREQALGPDHPDTAASLHNLAVVLQAQGDLAAARPLYDRALAIREQALGPDHPDTASSLNNLAGLLRAQGHLAAARPLFERALDIHEQAFGPNHPATATSLNNLAILLHAQGDVAAARPLFERALAIHEQALGPDHPATASGLSNLANLLHAHGDLAAARSLHERALAIREQALGPAHPDTANSLNNLAGLLQAQGDLAAARPLFDRALAIREQALGPNHPTTATSLNNLASLLQAQGDLAAARPLFERALAIHEKALGRTHPQTRKIAFNLATTLVALGQPKAAAALGKQFELPPLKPIRKNSFGAPPVLARKNVRPAAPQQAPLPAPLRAPTRHLAARHPRRPHPPRPPLHPHPHPPPHPSS